MPVIDFPRGSEWRKWDLHFHVPGTTMNDQYGTPPDWNRFCAIIENSDVAAFGPTDYFSAKSIFEFIDEFNSRYADSSKVFFPNVELRLTDRVNQAADWVHCHVIFSPETTRGKIEEFLGNLKTQTPDPAHAGRNLTCGELAPGQFDGATVTRDNLTDALNSTFGDRVRGRDFFILVPAGNDGIRAGDAQRPKVLTDQIDELADAIFGKARDSEYFLRTDRREDDRDAAEKPVFGGSDAHGFDDLESRLGMAVDTEHDRRTITWIKADPTMEGFRQTLVEPAERVRLDATRPDQKEPYHVITAVKFSSPGKFPEEIVLNPNLVSVIGARSSGKSALLAYLAHSVDPEYTERRQIEAGVSPPGPGAGLSWDQVADIDCEVEWAVGDTPTGKVIYIPQNSLFELSRRPAEITAKIAPAIFKSDGEYHQQAEQVEAGIGRAQLQIESSVHEWFLVRKQVSSENDALRGLGDLGAIEKTKAEIQNEVTALRATLTLTPEEIAQYEQLIEQLGQIDRSVDAARAEIEALDSVYPTHMAETDFDAQVLVEFRPRTPVSELPTRLDQILETAIRETESGLAERLRSELAALREESAGVILRLTGEKEALTTANAELISKNTATAELEKLLDRLKEHDAQILEIRAKSAHIDTLKARLAELVEATSGEISAIAESLQALETSFNSKDRETDEMAFGIEIAFDEAHMALLSEDFNQRNNSDYMNAEAQRIKIEAIQEAPGDFLEAVYRETQKLKKGRDKARTATAVLGAPKEVRYYAELEGDRIGGFAQSSMTPGKQALFALSLVLEESDEPWPLLIDQPEDDLDSRSIYDVLVQSLKARKRSRQIIMVSHNANLVVGSDSEQVIVANRHGTDRPNRNALEFDYLTGALENSSARKEAATVFESCGIREHACDLLDGGEEAFRKRQERYRI